MWINPLALKFSCTGAMLRAHSLLFVVCFVYVTEYNPTRCLSWLDSGLCDIMRGLENPLTSFKTH